MSHSCVILVKAAAEQGHQVWGYFVERLWGRSPCSQEGVGDGEGNLSRRGLDPTHAPHEVATHAFSEQALATLAQELAALPIRRPGPDPAFNERQQAQAQGQFWRRC